MEENDYVKLKEEFDKNRNQIDLQIKIKKNILNNLPKEISQLEKELDGIRPRIEGAEKNMTCKNCDIYSMMHTGTIPGQGERTFVYNCVICNYEETNH